MDLTQLKIGFIGFGNMAQAMAKGWILSDKIQPQQLFASARQQNKLNANTEKIGINTCTSNEELIDKVDLIIIAVKPYQILEVLSPLHEQIKDKILVSVAVNYLFQDLSEILPDNTQHLSTLPNTPVEFGDGVVLFEENHSLTDENFILAQNLFQLISHVEVLPPEQIAIAGIVTGSAPAFIDLFIEALGDAAVKHGLDRQTSYRLISQMIRGTANLQLKTGKHPGILKDQITSPGGTTIKGLASLEKNSFRGSIIKAVDEILKS